MASPLGQNQSLFADKHDTARPNFQIITQEVGAHDRAQRGDRCATADGQVLEEELVERHVRAVVVLVRQVAVVGDHDVAALGQLNRAARCLLTAQLRDVDPRLLIAVEHGKRTVFGAQVDVICALFAAAGQ